MASAQCSASERFQGQSQLTYQIIGINSSSNTPSPISQRSKEVECMFLLDLATRSCSSETYVTNNGQWSYHFASYLAEFISCQL